jgi:hypothetical protein
MARRHHCVTLPDANTPHMASTDDTRLLLADLIAATRLGDRAVLLQPYVPPSACPVCVAAYEAAQRILDEAGGVAAWLEIHTETPA